MTVRDWLQARRPVPPPALLQRIEGAIGDDAELPVYRVAACALAAAERLLVEVLAGGEAGRDRALDLLAVDALVTYAFEGAASQPAGLEKLADDAMKRIAAVGIGAPVAAC